MTTPYLGEIRLLPFNFAPQGWADCDGSLLGIAENETLFALLGTTYGGNGTTNFGLPDLRGRVPLHQGTGNGLSTRVMGQLGGSESVALTSAQMPAHSHGFNATSAGATANTPAANNQLGAVDGDTLYTSDIAGAQSFTTAPSVLAPAGASMPHDNLMPTLTVRFCIATLGIFPSQG